MKKSTLLYLVLLLIFFGSLRLLAQTKIDSLQKVLLTQKDDTNKVNTLNELAYNLRNSNYKECFQFSKQAIELSQKLNYVKGEGFANVNMGTAKIGMSDYSEALMYLKRGITISTKVGDKLTMSQAYNNMGQVQHYLGNLSEELSNYLIALKIREELGNLKAIAASYTNIGVVYLSLKNFDESIAYFNKALVLKKKVGDKRGMVIIYVNMGSLNNRKGNLHEALRYYNIGLSMAKAIKEEQFMPGLLLNIGNIYVQQKKYKEANDNYIEALSKHIMAGSKYQISLTYLALAKLNIVTNNFKAAEEYLLKSLKLANETNSKERLSEAYEQYARLDSILKHYPQAFEHFKLYISYRDSLINEENTKKTVRAQMNYEFDKKEATAKLEQEKKDAVVKSEINRQRIIRNSFIGGFGLVLLLALVIFNGYRNKQKANIIITQQKEEVELQKQIIEEKNIQITDSINYAKEIQQSILPDITVIQQALPDSFIFYQPKDILSGDFYFFYENETAIYLAAADCTGHGVPGALMSMICSDKLKEAVQHTGQLSEVLTIVNKGIQISLQQTGSKTANADGMDIALVKLNKNNKQELEYCGARSPLWIIRKGQKLVEEVRANNTTVGGSTASDFMFESHHVKINAGDTFYIFTDGYADQFGGANRKKMTVKKFKETLLGIQHLSMQEQAVSVASFVEEWKGNQTQIDDILVIGVSM